MKQSIFLFVLVSVFIINVLAPAFAFGMKKRTTPFSPLVEENLPKTDKSNLQKDANTKWSLEGCSLVSPKVRISSMNSGNKQDNWIQLRVDGFEKIFIATLYNTTPGSVFHYDLADQGVLVDDTLFPAMKGDQRALALATYISMRTFVEKMKTGKSAYFTARFYPNSCLLRGAIDISRFYEGWLELEKKCLKSTTLVNTQ